MSKDYYSTLGVARDASESEIKKAYRDMSKLWHPDKHKGEKKAEDKFKEINEAYEVIGNAKRKQQYDQFGSAGGPSGGGSAGAGGFDFSGFQQGDMGDLGDMFSSFFGGQQGGGRGRQRSNNRGRDIQVRITIDFIDVVKGAKKVIAIEKFVICQDCSGSGAADNGKLITCTDCNGTGQVTHTAQSFFGTIQQAVICGKCQGSGQVPEKPCTNCKGEGRKRDKAEITIDVPAGIHDGQTLRLQGQGDAGSHGDASGELYVQIQVKKDPKFIRDNDDIRTEINVSVLDAILGTDVKVQTVHGEVTLKIPAGTQPNQVMRLKGKGLPVLSSSRTGDHFVTVKIEVPKKLSKQEKKLYEELKKDS
jgi:molecular chaperone DnaJ